MPSNWQTIPAKHGTATFVPRGQTIKIINSYGKQIIETWAFALPLPPEEDPDEEEPDGEADTPAEPAKSGTEGTAKKAAASEKPKQSGGAQQSKEKPKQTEEKPKPAPKKPAQAKGKPEQSEKPKESKEPAKKPATQSKPKSTKTSTTGSTVDDSKPVKETENTEADAQAGSPESAAGARKGWSSYIPSIRRGKATGQDATSPTDGEAAEQASSPQDASGTAKKGWSSYIPYGQRKEGGDAPASPEDEGMTKSWASYIPYRHPKDPEGTSPHDGEEEGEGGDGRPRRSWKALIPSGQGFSSYLPSREAVGAFSAAHQRDPSKSYTQQLYAFSKTPVGAAALSAATGSGYSGTLYSAYKAYQPPTPSAPPTEFLSVSHTREASAHLSPRVGDALVSNLRRPLLTVVKDTSGGGHSTLLAACDAGRLQTRGEEGWEEAGSCAENLVMALKELNERIGLRGADAIGADVSVHVAPAPLCLFLRDEMGGKEGEWGVKEPAGRRGVFVTMRAERDVVVVMSDCPQRGDNSKVGHFVVEESEEVRQQAKREEEAEAKATKATPAKVGEKKRKPAPKLGQKKAPPKTEAPKADAPKADEKTDGAKKETAGAKKSGMTGGAAGGEAEKAAPKDEQPKPERKKPKKLQMRGKSEKSESVQG